MYVQFGRPRTATTLQFVTLCVSLALIHGPTTKCTFIPNDFGRRSLQIIKQIKTLEGPGEGGNPPSVYKTHSRHLAIDLISQPSRPQHSSFLFVTAVDPHYNALEKETRWRKAVQKVVRAVKKQNNNSLTNGKVVYASVTAALGGAKDPMLLADYVELLGMSEKQHDELKAYMEPWDKLRVCKCDCV